MRRARVVVCLLVLGFVASARLPAAAADDKWFEAKSAHFVVVTNGSDRSARRPRS